MGVWVALLAMHLGPRDSIGGLRAVKAPKDLAMTPSKDRQKTFERPVQPQGPSKDLQQKRPKTPKDHPRPKI
jgi:hypothetical protein